MQHTETQTDGVPDLERLGAELARLGFHARVHTLGDRRPYLDVRNPRASVLTEKVYVHGGAYCWSWAERIAECDQVATAAVTLARVLRTVDGE
jgi:hypothetical protein